MAHSTATIVTATTSAAAASATSEINCIIQDVNGELEDYFTTFDNPLRMGIQLSFVEITVDGCRRCNEVK